MCILKKLKDTKLHSNIKYIEGICGLNKIHMLLYKDNHKWEMYSFVNEWCATEPGTKKTVPSWSSLIYTK